MKGFCTKLNPNNKQRTLFLQHAGVARHAWNWGLELCKDRLKKGEKGLSGIDLHKLLVSDVKPENQWYYEVSKCSPQQALRDLPVAFNKFWKKHQEQKSLPPQQKYLKKYLIKKKKGEIEELRFEHEKGFPKFKKKGEHDSFYLEGNIIIEGNRIKVPRIGWLKTYEVLPEGISPKNIVIRRVAADWFISFKLESVIIPTNIIASTGVDLGIKTLATLSNGEKTNSPKPYKTYKHKLQRLQRKLSRQYEFAKKNNIKTGTNYEKTKLQIVRLHQKIAQIRLDSIHQLTNDLVKNHNRIVIEDLNVSGMSKNHHLASAILDGGFYEFRRQLEYKCKWNGIELIVADRWFASSKTCSKCGHKQNMPLKKRVFICEECDLVIDRDVNAAINLNNYTPSYEVKDCEDAKFHAKKQVGVSEAVIRHQTRNVQVCVSS